MNPPDKNIGDDLGGTKVLSDISGYRRNIEREKLNESREAASTRDDGNEHKNT